MSDQPTHLHTQLDPVDQEHVRGKFVSRIGFILAAVGSAVGLGNIWKFPYIMGQHGGAAFILVYLGCIGFVALPVLLGEFALGRFGKTSAVSTYRKAAPGTWWWLNGLMGVVAGFMILSFYTAVAGWVVKYFVVAFTSEGYDAFLVEGDIAASTELSGKFFGSFITGTWGPLFYQGVTLVLTALIVFCGIEKGIERASKWMLPVLFGLLLILAVRSLSLEGAMEGVEFMLRPDFGKLTGWSLLEALGHSFFTLSIGMGVMLTYGSYVDKSVHLGKAAATVAVFDTMAALLAGLVIFPAVFAFGLPPGQGPSLIFVTLPQVFAMMPAGNLIGGAFFFLVFIAALTSTISILEAIVTYLVDDANIKRHVATAVALVLLWLVAIPACLSVDEGSPLGGIEFPFLGPDLRFFDLMDTITARFMMPLGGFVLCVFYLIRWGQQNAVMAVPPEGASFRHWTLTAWYWCLVTISPIGIGAMLFFGIRALVKSGTAAP